MSIGDLLAGLHGEPARLERAEQDAGGERAPRRGAAEEGDRDRVEADARVDAAVKPVVIVPRTWFTPARPARAPAMSIA
jgi:hypothetical protein